jgi:hypothetical protein
VGGLMRATYAYLRVTSQVLTTEQITRLAGVFPDRSDSLGAPLRRTGRLRTFTSWALDSGIPPGDHVRLEDHLDALFPRVQAIVPGFAGRSELSIDLDIVQYLDNTPAGDRGIWLTTDWILLLSSIGAGLDIDQYVNDVSEPDE